MELSLELARGFVQKILENPLGLSWSVQGLGMLRLYLDKTQRYRLHIWDSSLRVPNVSPIHDHPWHLKSFIVAGVLEQKRYYIGGITSAVSYVAGCDDALPSEILQMSFIKCGEGACTKTEPIAMKAYDCGLEVYTPGQSYSQFKDEVHESMAKDGTVTIVDRTFTADRDTARVFWRGNGGWVDAAPRRATDREVLRVTQRALEGF